jgi:saccharopine dehydrogenase (NAD+, L-lysine forming)
MNGKQILIVGGYGEVGRRLAAQLERTEPGRVIVAGRNPERAGERPSRKIDVADPGSIDQALENIAVVVACVRQPEPHLLRAAIRRGIAYTSIAPPWIPWPDTQPLRDEAQRTGARIVLAAGIEPGISSVMVRAAAEKLGAVDSVETGLLLGLGDAYGTDSMGFIFEELTQTYAITVGGREIVAQAFERPRRFRFPPPVGERRTWTMPFRDQLYYPHTVGAKTAIARIALDPPWLGATLAAALPIGLRAALRSGGRRGALRGLIDRLKVRYAELNQFSLVVEVTGRGRLIRGSLSGRGQAEATAAGVGAITQALWAGEVAQPGVWLAEQVIAPRAFFARLEAQGLRPVFEEAVPQPMPRAALA